MDEISPGAKWMTTPNDVHGPLEGVTAPRSAPQVAPHDWLAERDAGHVWGAISGVRQELGQLTTSVQTNTAFNKEVRDDIKELKSELGRLQAQTSSHLSFVKGAVWVAGIVIAVASFLLAWSWNSIIQPGLAHAIVEQLKPEIRKQVSEEVSNALPKPRQQAPRP
jgi:hypothetical protein